MKGSFIVPRTFTYERVHLPKGIVEADYIFYRDEARTTEAVDEGDYVVVDEEGEVTIHSEKTFQMFTKTANFLADENKTVRRGGVSIQPFADGRYALTVNGNTSKDMTKADLYSLQAALYDLGVRVSE